MTDTAFKENLAFLSKYLKYQLDQSDVSIYWNCLKHLSDEKFRLSVTQIVKEFIPTNAVPFPLVAHFLERCGEAGETKSINAIATLKKAVRKIGIYNSVHFDDPALTYTVNVCGGWINMCNWSSTDWNVNEGRIRDIYEAAINSGRSDSGHLVGIGERDNGVYTLYKLTHGGTKAITERKSPWMLTQAQKLQEIEDNSESSKIVSELLEKLPF